MLDRSLVEGSVGIPVQMVASVTRRPRIAVIGRSLFWVRRLIADRRIALHELNQELYVSMTNKKPPAAREQPAVLYFKNRVEKNSSGAT